MKLIACKLAGAILREETVNGRLMAVVPVIPIIEGVHQGINAVNQPGPRLYYPSQELSNSFQSLSGIPVTLHHPVSGNDLVSATSQAGQPFVIGEIHNPRFEAGRILAEAWLDVERLTAMSPQTFENLKAGIPTDVSIGFGATEVVTPGTWNTEAYDGIVTNLTYDHLALLPGAAGACSWNDGCGVRANEKTIDKPKEIKMKPNWKALIALMTGKHVDTTDTRVTALITAKGSPFVEEDREWLTGLGDKALLIMANELSHEEIGGQLWDFVNSLDSPEYINFRRDVYDGYFIYQTTRRDNMTGAPVATRLYKRSFTIDQANGKVTVADDAVEVTEKTEYVPVDTTTANSNPNQENAVKEEKVNALIACDRTPFKEEHRTMLMGLSECALDLLQADNFKPATPVAPTAAAAAPAAALTEPAKPKTVAEFLSSAPAEIADPLRRMMAREEAVKTAIIEKITANDGCPFTKEELGSKDLGELQKVAALAKIPVEPIVDFTPAAGTSRANEGPKVPEMPSTAPAVATK